MNEYDLIPTARTLADPFGKIRHDNYGERHSGRWAHFCWEWDELWICEDCGEFDACLCCREIMARDFDESNCRFGE